MEKRVIPVLEMSCAVCAATVEKTVRELAGVEEASVNFSANTLQVVYDPDKISLKDMQAAVSAAGYDLVISENAETDAIDAEHRLYLDLRRRTIGAWSFGLPVMVLSMIFHSPSQRQAGRHKSRRRRLVCDAFCSCKIPLAYARLPLKLFFESGTGRSAAPNSA